ncbi:MAG: bifunctional ADP-heptose synthase [Bacteroidota bacterium]
MFSESVNSYEKLFATFSEKNVLIVGDVMIDTYYWGKVERISPEAPVPVVNIQNTDFRLGGAANVALNVQELGANPILCSLIGNDRNGEDFISLLKEYKMSASGIVSSNERPTTNKVRVIGNNAQMLRIDMELDASITTKENKKLIERIEAIFEQQRINVVVFEDYDKGVITPELIKHISAYAIKNNIPLIADPKKRNFNHYKNFSLFKPNFKELREGLAIDLKVQNHKQLFSTVSRFQEKQNIDILLVTLSEHGVLVSAKNAENVLEQKLIPAHYRNIADVSGAGDTLTATAALCLACAMSPTEIAAISNLAGGLVCEKVGVVPIGKEKLLKEILCLKK